MTNPNDMAYPIDSGEGNFSPGLTKREYFATLAMQGNLSGTEEYPDADQLAAKSVAYADALIEALNAEVTR